MLLRFGSLSVFFLILIPWSVVVKCMSDRSDSVSGPLPGGGFFFVLYQLSFALTFSPFPTKLAADVRGKRHRDWSLDVASSFPLF